MKDASTHLEDVGAVVAALNALGLDPVLIGGMALVTLGSRRVTRDFDFVVSRPGALLPRVVAALYDHGLELASRLNADGDVTATIDNRRVAALRLRLDAPSSAYFFNPLTGLRVDLLFDFPIAAAELGQRATRATLRAATWRIASVTDLLRLKRIALSARSAPGDAEDVAFLEARLAAGE